MGILTVADVGANDSLRQEHCPEDWHADVRVRRKTDRYTKGMDFMRQMDQSAYLWGLTNAGTVRPEVLEGLLVRSSSGLFGVV